MNVEEEDEEEEEEEEEVSVKLEDEECGGDKYREVMRGRDKERERETEGEGEREETSVSHPNRHFRWYGEKTPHKKRQHLSSPSLSLSFFFSYLLATVWAQEGEVIQGEERGGHVK